MLNACAQTDICKQLSRCWHEGKCNIEWNNLRKYVICNAIYHWGPLEKHCSSDSHLCPRCTQTCACRLCLWWLRPFRHHSPLSDCSQCEKCYCCCDQTNAYCNKQHALKASHYGRWKGFQLQPGVWTGIYTGWEGALVGHVSCSSSNTSDNKALSRLLRHRTRPINQLSSHRLRISLSSLRKKQI